MRHLPIAINNETAKWGFVCIVTGLVLTEPEAEPVHLRVQRSSTGDWSVASSSLCGLWALPSPLSSSCITPPLSVGPLCPSASISARIVTFHLIIPLPQWCIHAFIQQLAVREICAYTQSSRLLLLLMFHTSYLKGKLHSSLPANCVIFKCCVILKM